MNPFGMFQGFGQMNRSDFKRPYRDRPAPPSLGQMNRSDFRAPVRSPQPPARRPVGGAGNINPYGNSPGRSNVDPYGVGGTRRVSPRPVAPQPPARRPVGGNAAADYRVPAGQAPMPMAPQRAPANSTASRSNAVMAPLGASRNEALVQAAGNAGMRLVDPASLSTPASNGVLPGAPGSTGRRMLSELGGGRPVPVSAADFGAGGGIAQGAAFPESGDRFSGLRPDLAAWARSNQGAARGADGLNIVDRFMAKQGAAPLVTPAGLPQTMAIDAAPGPLLTNGADTGLTAEQQTQAGAAADFNLNADLIDQVQLMREAYRNNSRPNPGAANLPY